VPIRVEKLLATGFGLSRSAVRVMVDSGRIRLPLAIDAKAREDFTVFVIARHRRRAMQQRIRRRPA
jgi:RNA-binding protein YlmH